MSVQEAQWRWHGDLFSYHRPYIEKLVEGLRKAGVPEGSGMDVSFNRYRALIHRQDDGGFTVDGVRDLAALSAGTLFDRGVRFVDVRAHGGYSQGHVPGAINLSLVFDLSKDALMKVARPQDQIVFYCDSKYCEYSAIAAAKAVLWGYTRVYRIAGGVPAWKDANCPMEVASKK
jgi:adenylate cyclase